jgi:glyoxylase-like metal-dependent hydrolase (beta-lactamase superfamily II)
MESFSGVHRLTLGVANWYLVQEGGKVTLVDAGTPRDWALLQKTLAGLDTTLDAVEAVLLTHCHHDHTGFAERARIEAGSRVFIHEADADRVRGGAAPPNEVGKGRYLLRLEAWRTKLKAIRSGLAKVPPVLEVSTFADGETIDAPGRPRAIHAPGHTDGSAALWFDDRSVLCTGDALVTHNPLTGRRGPQIMPAAFNLDSERALESVPVFELTRAEVLLPGHGEPWTEGAAEAVRRAAVAGPS